MYNLESRELKSGIEKNGYLSTYSTLISQERKKENQYLY